MHECPGHRGLLQAAVDLAQLSGGFVHVGPIGAGRFLELDVERAASFGSVEPANVTTAGLVQQRLRDASSG